MGPNETLMIGADTRPVRVALQQNHPLFRTGLALLLPTDPDVEVVGSVSILEQLVSLCGRAQPAPDVALLDGESDLALLAATTGELRHTHPDLVLVALAVQRGTGRSLLDAGFNAVVERRAGVGTIIAAVLRAAGRATKATRPASGELPSVLSGRESEVLSLLSRGMTVRAIAGHLAISAKTVEHHKSRIFEKLQTHNQAHSVSVALRTGILSVEHPLGRS